MCDSNCKLEAKLDRVISLLELLVHPQSQIDLSDLVNRISSGDRAALRQYNARKIRDQTQR